MCDFSLEHYISRKAEKGDRLMLYRFPTTTIGTCRIGEGRCPTCLQPGTELAFERNIVLGNGVELLHQVAVFVKLDAAHSCVHRDAIETPDGMQYTLQNLQPGQALRVLQAPAEATVESIARELKLDEPKQDLYRGLQAM